MELPNDRLAEEVKAEEKKKEKESKKKSKKEIVKSRKFKTVAELLVAKWVSIRFHTSLLEVGQLEMASRYRTGEALVNSQPF